MEFKYTSSIFVSESDLVEMVKRVKEGEIFNNVFFDILARYDNCDFYNRSLIQNDVRKEIERRIG